MNRLCLFDFDGTLIDPHTAITTAAQYALATEGINVMDRNELNPFIGPPLRDSLQEFYNITDQEKIERIVDKYREYFLEHGIYQNKLYPGVIAMLQQLKDAGLTLAIATSKLMQSAQKIAEYHEFDHYFDLIIGCEYDGTRSRKSEIIDYILTRLDPERRYSPIMIGDRKYDIIGAREMEIDSIGVTWGYGSREELERENPTLIVDSVEALSRVLTYK